MDKGKIAVIIGPTAVGKTNLSIELALRYNGEIISGDSMQVYKGMDIGTAKITAKEQRGVPHHLIDIKEPDEPFSAAEFQQRANEAAEEIRSRGRLPIIAGGTGLYIQSVLYDYHFTETPSDPVYRAELEEEIMRHGIEPVYSRLLSIDPESAEKIHPNNSRRVIRALEIFHCTGETMSSQLEQQPEGLKYQTALIGLTMEREKLYSRIDQRVDLMMEEGLLEEAGRFYREGLRNCQSIQAIGYKELYGYFDGTYTLEEAVAQIKQNSRRYAKRQLTWFRNKMDVKWFDLTDTENISGKNEEISAFMEGKLDLKAN